jgi:glycosyltransferase involved in cell wall biosynthesis
MMTSRPLMASVIICTYNRAERLRRVLETLNASIVNSAISWEVVVVDNNSSDHTSAVVDAMARACPVLLRYVFESRQGKSNALNRGIATAGGELLLFTDDDVEVAPDWIQRMVEGFADVPCSAIGGRIVAAWNGAAPSWYSDRGPYRLMAAIVQYEHGDTPFFTTHPPFGANLAIRKPALESIGGFRVDLGPNATQGAVGGGAEDTELCNRLLAAGHRILYLPGAVVYHPVEPERTTRRYFEQWYFRYGRAIARQTTLNDPGARILGVPRYLLRIVATDVLRWWSAVGEKPRFFNRLRVYQTLGVITECFSARRSGNA